MNKRGQVTLFIILGLIIVIAGILIYFFVPGVKSAFQSAPENPNLYLMNCLEDSFAENINLISLQGGTLNPQNYFVFENSKVYYSCYTSDYYENCVVQEPFIKSRIERELTESMTPKVNECLNSLKKVYESKGYSVSISQGEYQVEILPGRTALKINRSLSVSKNNKQNYESFIVNVNNNLYQVVGVVRSIINGESLDGQIETTDYMELYPDLKIEKIKQTDGTKIYKITDQNTKEVVFNIASRSQVFPPGLI